MKILYAVDNFILFNQCRAFLIEMPYKHYIKDLQAEINNDRSLFPNHNNHFAIKNNIEIKNHINIINEHVYFWASEDLSMFKLLTSDDIGILNDKKTKPLNKKVFSMFYLLYISIEMTIAKYTKSNDDSELLQKKFLYKKSIDPDVDNKQWIADYYFMKYMNQMEITGNNDFSFKSLFSEFKNIMIEYFIKDEDRLIIINEKIEIVVLIRITKGNKFGDIGYVLCKNINSVYIGKIISAETLYRLIKKYGKLFTNNDFQNLDEKYLKQFHMI